MPDAVVIKVFGSDELMIKLRTLTNFFQSEGFRGVLEDAGQAYVDLAKREVPVSRSPGATGLVAGGALRNSINYRVAEFGTPGVRLEVGAGGPGARYASYVEEGTKDSIRMAINKQVMFWQEDGAGRTINQPFTGVKGSGWSNHYRKIVWHPGTRPQPFFFKHADKIAQRLIAAISREITRQFRGYLGTRD